MKSPREPRLAVHFGAGNIGRGFIGAVLQDAGYHVVFADVNEALIRALREKGRYNLTELGNKPTTRTYTDFTALSSLADSEQLVNQIAQADIVTASVGAPILDKIAPTIEAGIRARTMPGKLIVMACENAIDASDLLFEAMLDREQVATRAVFLNTAVDRIVPIQPEGSEPDVAVEDFSEWVIDVARLDGKLDLPGATLVSNLGPFIERKLYTVNTAHLATAYLGQLAGHQTIVEALSDSDIRNATAAVLGETSQVLIAKHKLDPKRHEAYVAKTLARIANPAVDDEIVRVGRQPLRKLAKNERLIGPALYFAEHFGEPKELLGVVSAALSFQSDDEPEVQRLGLLLASLTTEEFVAEVFGVVSHQALHKYLVTTVDSHKRALAHQGSIS
jgi:mannitol-1-phosphate 5-dehydrogenase